MMTRRRSGEELGRLDLVDARLDGTVEDVETVGDIVASFKPFRRTTLTVGHAEEDGRWVGVDLTGRIDAEEHEAGLLGGSDCGQNNLRPQHIRVKYFCKVYNYE